MGKKLVLEDLGEMQQDVIDVFARKNNPIILAIAREAAHHLTEAQRKAMDQVIKILEPWEGSFEETSIGATVSTRWDIQFRRSLFSRYTNDEM